MNPIVKKYLKRFFQFLKTLMLAYMIGLANIVKEETRFIEDTPTKIEYRQKVTDDEQVKDVE